MNFSSVHTSYFLSIYVFRMLKSVFTTRLNWIFSHRRWIQCRSRESSPFLNEKITLNANLYKNAITTKSSQRMHAKGDVHCFESSHKRKKESLLQDCTSFISDNVPFALSFRSYCKSRDLQDVPNAFLQWWYVILLYIFF